MLTGCRGAVLSLLRDHGLVLTEDVKIWDWCCTSGTDIDPVTYDKCVAKNLPSLMWLLWDVVPCASEIKYLWDGTGWKKVHYSHCRF